MPPCFIYRAARDFVNPHGLYDDRLRRQHQYQGNRRWNDRRIENWIGNTPQNIGRPSPNLNGWLNGVSPRYCNRPHNIGMPDRDIYVWMNGISATNGERRVLKFAGKHSYDQWGPEIRPYQSYVGYGRRFYQD